MLAQQHDIYIYILYTFTVQALSTTTANAMEYFKIPDAEETIRFIRMIDRAFDCLNVRSR